MKKFVILNILLLITVNSYAADCKGPESGYYENNQAKLGKQLFSESCASCHGSDLSGQSGPALTGKDFVSYLKFTKISAKQLLAFMESQMPYQAPGSLSKSDYINIFSYILSVNGYKSGKVALDEDNVGCISMLPHPHANQ